jgi:hypothetical protein
MQMVVPTICLLQMRLLHVIPGDGSEERSDHRDIVLRLSGGDFKRISHLHPSYSALHYTMLFPRGEEGYHTTIPMNIPEGATGRSKFVSQRCYYAYRLQTRPGEHPLLLRGGRLLQQYVVDAWASTEQSELNWIRNNQKNSGQINIKICAMLQMKVHKLKTEASVLSCLPLILEAHVTCISSFKIQWPSVVIAESLICSSQ